MEPSIDDFVLRIATVFGRRQTMNAYFCDDDWLLPITFTAYVPADSVRCRTSGVVPPASTPVTLVVQPLIQLDAGPDGKIAEHDPYARRST